MSIIVASAEPAKCPRCRGRGWITDDVDCPTCEGSGTAADDHPRLVVHRSISELWDDNSTEWGQCATCESWLVRTSWRTRDGVEYAPMTAAQVDCMQRIEDRYRRSEAT